MRFVTLTDASGVSIHIAAHRVVAIVELRATPGIHPEARSAVAIEGRGEPAIVRDSHLVARAKVEEAMK